MSNKTSGTRAARTRGPGLTITTMLILGLVVGALGAEAPDAGSSPGASSADDLWGAARKQADVVRFSTLFTAQNVRDHLAAPEGMSRALQWCRETAVTKVYLESFRDGYTAERAVLAEATRRFRAEGFIVSGCITTTGLGKKSVRGWSFPCFTDPATLEKLARTAELTAGLFDEIMIDDFFATGCECDECQKARGDRSWSAFRCDLLAGVSRRYLLEPALRVNPDVRIIIKYPQWYDRFHERGYDVARQTEMFDRIWVGTETRDPDNQRWGRKSQYEAYFIMRWLGGIGGAKCGGGWFDPYGTSPPTYVEQARQTILAGAREALLFCYGSLQRETGPANIEALRRELPLLFRLAALVRGREIRGIAAPKPPGSDPHGDSYIYDFAGLLGLPLAPAAEVRTDVRAAFLPAQALADEKLEEKLAKLLEARTPLLLTRSLCERLPEAVRALPDHVKVLEVPEDPWKLMDLPAGELEVLRRHLLAPFGIELEAPARVALYLFEEDLIVVESFNDRAVDVFLRTAVSTHPESVLTIPGADVPVSGGPGAARFRLPPRSLIALRFPRPSSRQAARQVIERAERLAERLHEFLCAYDPQAANHGIYWIDRAGNRELIYRDPAISCLSPIPLRPRPRPPVLPAQTAQTAAARKSMERGRRATIAVTSVYDSDFDWPPGTRIEALRIIHVLPKTTPPPNEPRIGVADQTNARAVLGTVPVEEDGSAYFEAPVGKPIYFQALDRRGMAVQSMRSATYVHPGEQLVCRGCHEGKRRSPAQPAEVPAAFRRPPSKIVPDVDGSNPFNYVRLVQPVLDRNCVKCHRERGALDLSGAIEDPGGWTRSYRNLAGEYGFYFHVSNGAINTGMHGGSRTVAGEFGARASRLLDYLNERHYRVSLSPEDFHRLTLWLDCNSEFYGAYEDTEAQSRGEAIRPSLD